MPSAWECTTLKYEGMSDDIILSVRAGQVRRQATISSGKSFRFPKITLQDNPLKVDILQQIGTTYVVLKPEEEQYKCVFTKDGDDSVHAELQIKQLPPDHKEPPVDMDEKVRVAAAQAKEAKDYLESYNMMEFIEAALQTLVKEKPKDPFYHMARHFMSGYHPVGDKRYNKVDQNAVEVQTAMAEELIKAMAEEVPPQPDSPKDADKLAADFVGAVVSGAVGDKPVSGVADGGVAAKLMNAGQYDGLSEDERLAIFAIDVLAGKIPACLQSGGIAQKLKNCGQYAGLSEDEKLAAFAVDVLAGKIPNFLKSTENEKLGNLAVGILGGNVANKLRGAGWSEEQILASFAIDVLAGKIPGMLKEAREDENKLSNFAAGILGGGVASQLQGTQQMDQEQKLGNFVSGVLGGGIASQLAGSGKADREQPLGNLCSGILSGGIANQLNQS